MSERLIQIGIVGKAHGLRGRFYLSHRDELLHRTPVKVVITRPNEQSPVCTEVRSQQQVGRRIVLECQGIQHRDQAEQLIGCPVYMSREDLINEPQDLLWGDLIGCLVVDANLVEVGQVSDLQNFGAGDILVVQRDSKTLYLPWASCDRVEDRTIHLKTPAETYNEYWQ